jgi:hypothetical protein
MMEMRERIRNKRRSPWWPDSGKTLFSLLLSRDTFVLYLFLTLTAVHRSNL